MLLVSFKAFKLLRYFSFGRNSLVRSVDKDRWLKFAALFVNLGFLIYFLSLWLLVVTAWDTWLPPLFYEVEVAGQEVYESSFHRLLVSFYYTTILVLGD